MFYRAGKPAELLGTTEALLKCENTSVGAVLSVKANKSVIIVNFCSILSYFTIPFVSFSYQQILRREERRKCVQYWISFFVMLLRLERRCKSDFFCDLQL